MDSCISSSIVNVDVVSSQTLINNNTTANRFFRINDIISEYTNINYFSINMHSAGTVYMYEMDTDNTIVQTLGVYEAIEGINVFTDLDYNVTLGNYLCIYTNASIKYGAYVGKSIQYMTPHAPANINDVLTESTLINNQMLCVKIQSIVTKFQPALLQQGNKVNAFFGDSISMAISSRNWIEKLKTKMIIGTVLNYAKSGARISHDVSTTYDLNPSTAIPSNNVIWNQWNILENQYDNELIEKPDNIIIFAGMNDFLQGTLKGDATTTFSDTSTVLDLLPNEITEQATSFRYLIEKIREKWADINIVYITMYQRGASSFATRDSITLLNDNLEKCCKYLGIPCVRPDNIFPSYSLNEYNGNVMLYDTIHLNELGSDRFAELMSRLLSIYLI